MILNNPHLGCKSTALANNTCFSAGFLRNYQNFYNSIYAKRSYLLCFEAKNLPEYLVDGVMFLYKDCETAVSVDGELSSSFSVKVGVHQGSTLSPMLFIILIDVLTEHVRDCSLFELLYADNLVLSGKSLNGQVLEMEKGNKKRDAVIIWKEK